MKSSFIIISFAYCFNLMAEVSRSPAVVEGACDLDIPTTIIKIDSEKKFKQEISHKVTILSDDGRDCSTMPKKQYPDSIYENHVRNEMDLLFKKYPENYSQKCAEFFKRSGLKKSDYVCREPSIVSISFVEFGCDKKVATADVKITYQQSGLRVEEKSLEQIQKEQCTRVNECLEQASSKEISELKKLASVACKNELVPINTGRAPAIEKDSSFDGKRIPKSTNKNGEIAPFKREETNTVGR